MDFDKLAIEHRKLLERVSALEGRPAGNPGSETAPAPAPAPAAPEVTKSSFDDLVKRTEQEIARLTERLSEIDTQIAE